MWWWTQLLWVPPPTLAVEAPLLQRRLRYGLGCACIPRLQAIPWLVRLICPRKGCNRLLPRPLEG